MARVKKTKKPLEVQKFGGAESLGSVKEVGNFETFKSELSGSETAHAEIPWDVESVEAKSETTLEQDEGYGNAIIIRCFEFGVNPEAFAQYRPTKQELFNSHLKGIEVALWKDGLKVWPDVQPRIVFDESGKKYSIFVAAVPSRGHLLNEMPQTLSQIVHGNRPQQR